MRRWIVCAAVVVSFGFVGQVGAADEAQGVGEGFADSPTSIRPLLVGASVPSAALVGLDGAPVALTEAVTAAPSVVIFYRGGW